jgi:hypothetical protein
MSEHEAPEPVIRLTPLADPFDESILATVHAADFPAQPVTWILRRLVGHPARLETFLHDLDVTLSDCLNGAATVDDVMTLLAYWVTILKLQHQPA